MSAHSPVTRPVWRRDKLLENKARFMPANFVWSDICNHPEIWTVSRSCGDNGSGQVRGRVIDLSRCLTVLSVGPVRTDSLLPLAGASGFGRYLPLIAGDSSTRIAAGGFHDLLNCAGEGGGLAGCRGRFPAQPSVSLAGRPVSL